MEIPNTVTSITFSLSVPELFIIENEIKSAEDLDLVLIAAVTIF